MTLRTCPVCEIDIHGDEEYFSFHVNQCIESGQEPPAKRRCTSHHDDDEPVCPVCTVPFISLLNITGQEDQHSHIQACLLHANGDLTSPKSNGHRSAIEDEEDEICPVCGEPWPADSERTVHAALCLDERVHQGGFDREAGETTVEESPFEHGTTHHAPIKACPGVLPILYQLLQRVSSKGTRSACLCMAETAYISGQISYIADLGWGCGYRNMQMMLSVARTMSDYHGAFKLDDEGKERIIPSIPELQVLIEKGWDMGFDPAGRDHFNGKLKGRRKWIGTTEVYVALTLLGIRATIYDFPKANGRGGTHTVLTKWVQRYFDDAPNPTEVQTDDAFDALMQTDGNPVRRTTRPPLFLQHEGHSRTIVGYETTHKGDLHLLVFDPSKACPMKIRKAAAEDPPCRLVAAPPAKRLLAFDPRSPLTLDDAPKTLETFRVSIKSLSRNKQYQILSIEPGPVLSAEERGARKRVKSTLVT